MALFLLALAGCAKPPLYTQESYVFGTRVEVSIYGEPEAKARRVTAQVLRDFDEMHHSLHAWEPGTLERMNGIFELSPSQAAIAPGMIPIIRDATRYSEQSQGLFNPAIGNLIRLWGFQSDTFKAKLPDPAKIAELVRANPQMRDIVIDGILFHSTNPAVRLDLGGYAKGYALDVAARYLRSQGVKNALINIGGNVMALGQHGDRSWRVGIQNPRGPGPIATLDLRDGEAIGTSGDYQRYFEVGGKRYCHIIDPRTGWPAQGVRAVTVLIPPSDHAGTLSDVASKPIFISGSAGWRAAAQRMGVADVMFIDGQGHVELTDGMKQRLHFETGS
ncbi:thiamin biosynthesis lipoprotein ApbE [Sulfuriferula multivorans]|uniref:FAD:protein FMN transferase n=1 Tax=Sulfuriferula multivorans TaxID=1559896 RepID=A0A401JH87_9PROT|nr:FAD:protein FMN transferase [Sulfuriferula multivorans]GBL47334.1 thiamin biosynthesis lipoprotein ApbE [Sulfuriferula multivorans]